MTDPAGPRGSTSPDRRPTSRLAAAVVAALTLLTPLVMVVDQGAAASSSGGRQSRSSGVAVGGANVFVWSKHRSEDSGSGCTLAFAVKSRTTGRRGVLTAGHCVQTLPGGPVFVVHQTRRVTADGTAPGDLLGRVGSHAYHVGHGGDNAFIRLAHRRRALPQIFVGDVFTRSTIPVVGRARLERGIQVCYSGAASGEHCGFTVVGHAGKVMFLEGRHKVTIYHEWRARGASCTSRKGDSGSPVYVREGDQAYAVGILSGGQSRPHHCPFFFTPVRLALKELNLRLIKG